MTINANSTLMIMTTEILRSMLYRGSELCREMAWVIFDEVRAAVGFQGGPAARRLAGRTPGRSRKARDCLRRDALQQATRVFCI